MTVRPKLFESMKPRPILCFFVSSVFETKSNSKPEKKKIEIVNKGVIICLFFFHAHAVRM